LLFNRKKGEWLGQFLTPNRLAEAISRFVGWEKDIKYNIAIVVQVQALYFFPYLEKS
jgi:hypothetical protein